MVVVHLKGYITEDGELKLNTPEELRDLLPGEVDVTVKSRQTVQADANADVEWTEEELKEALTFHPVPANQIVLEPRDGEEATEDSLATVLERRRKKRDLSRSHS